jgi:toxin HigB-1
MEVTFSDPAYDRLETDRSYTHNLPSSVVSAYRMRLQLLRAARDENDLAAMRCLCLRPLQARSQRRRTIQLDSEYRLVLEVLRRSGEVVVRIVEVRIHTA